MITHVRVALIDSTLDVVLNDEDLVHNVWPGVGAGRVAWNRDFDSAHDVLASWFVRVE